MEFIYLFLYRSLSGLQNGLGYADRKTMRTVTSIVLILLAAALASFSIWIQSPWYIIGIVWLGAIISGFGAWGVDESFDNGPSWKYTDIHFWEMLATSGVMLSVIALGGDLIMILGSVYPALIIHKGLINTLSGLSWWYHGTDDPTGKTFSIPLLGIKIRRMGRNGRIIAALISIVLVAAAWILHWNLSVYKLIDILL